MVRVGDGNVHSGIGSNRVAQQQQPAGNLSRVDQVANLIDGGNGSTTARIAAAVTLLEGGHTVIQWYTSDSLEGLRGVSVATHALATAIFAVLWFLTRS